VVSLCRKEQLQEAREKALAQFNKAKAEKLEAIKRRGESGLRI
jgi:hypothetical protein